jgi:hypothetical protein
MACESIRAALAENESKRNALAARLGPAQNDAQFAFDALQSALRLRTQNLSESFVASYNGREFRGPNAVEDYIAFVQNDFNTKRDIRRDLGLEFNALFPEKERLEKELAECEATPTGPVDSAGQIAVNDDAARTSGAQTQNPAVEPETVTADGTVVTPPDTVTTTNAAPATGNAASGGVLPPPGSLPNNTSSSAGNVATVSGPPATTVSTPAAPNNTNSLINTFGTSSATQSYIYRAIKVTHYFKGGKFTQQLNGSLVIYDVPPQNNSGSTQADGNAGEAEAQRAEAQRRAVPALPGPTPRQDPVVPPPAPEISTPSTPGTDAGVPADDSAPFTPGETAPPTSGNDAVAVTPAPTPPSSITVAGATLQASLQISGRVFISLTLPSGKSEFNVDGWGDQQWDSLITTLTDTADITAANSLKASWPTLQAQLRASVQTPAAVAAPSQNMAKEA